MMIDIQLGTSDGALRTRLIGAFCLLAIAGCGQRLPPRVVQEGFDPGSVSRAIFAKADADGDGFLSAKELDTIAGLKSALDVLDTDGDKRLSSAEVSRWLQDLRDSRVARALAGILVSQKGRPVANATVTLVPDPAMGGSLSEAEGQTDEVGYVSPRIKGSAHAGASVGIYRVVITGVGLDGKPIPPKYNTETILGIAVGAIPPESYGVKFDLE